MTRYDLLWARWAILSMFEPTTTWPNLEFGKLFMSIGAYNGQIWLSRGYKRDFEQSLKRLQLDLMLLVVNLWYEFGEITTRYVFLYAGFVIWLAIDLLLLLVIAWISAHNAQIWLLEARWMIFSNIRTDFNCLFRKRSVSRKPLARSTVGWAWIWACRLTQVVKWPINSAS